MAAHYADCSAAGISFLPLVAESLGGWNQVGRDTISRVGRLLALRSGSLPADSVRHLFQRLSVCIWRGNARMILNRLPTIPPNVDGLT